MASSSSSTRGRSVTGLLEGLGHHEGIHGALRNLEDIVEDVVLGR